MGTDLIVECACGFEARGEPATLVPIVRQHGRDVHNMDATVEEVLAMARPADGDDTAPGRGQP